MCRETTVLEWLRLSGVELLREALVTTVIRARPHFLELVQNSALLQVVFSVLLVKALNRSERVQANYTA